MTTPRPWLERPRFRVDLEAISAVEYSCSAWYAKKSRRAGGIITFRGEYRYGSSGTDDARYIKWKIQQFCDIDHPKIDGLIIDFRELDYRWGDDLSIHGARRLPSPGSDHYSRPILPGEPTREHPPSRGPTRRLRTHTCVE